jgi:RimJ/RimL family protein N-acetyltransferase
MVDWRDRLPAGYSTVPVDRDFLAQTDMHGYAEIAERADAWPSQAAFIAQNFGVGIVCDGAIVSHAIADCVVGDRCELGVGTHPAHRRRGLGSIAAAAAVERALTAGIKDVGWHCLCSNRGSMVVAARVGFEPAADYIGYSLSLPAENAGDLSTAECVDWAEHCERASAEIAWSAFFAAGAWALAGDESRTLANVQRLIDTNWQGQPEWLEKNWMFTGLQENPAFKHKLAALRAQRKQ